MNDQQWVRTYWHDEYKAMVNLIMKQVNVNNQGLELGIEKSFNGHSLQCAAGAGVFVFTNRPVLEAWQDNNNKELYKDRTSYLKNYKTGGTPQQVAGAGYRYTHRTRWSAGISFNYFDQLFLEPNPDRRTAEAVSRYNENEKEMAARIVNQQRLPAYYILNLSISKSLRVAGKYFIYLNGTVNNLFNNTDILVTGFEQLRWDRTYPEKFAPKYLYMNGLTYMISVNVNF
jgi:hypothetical protein